MHVYIYTYMYVYTSSYIHIYIYTFVFMYFKSHIYRYVYIYNVARCPSTSRRSWRAGTSWRCFFGSGFRTYGSGVSGFGM